jgi:hypothetical protein
MRYTQQNANISNEVTFVRQVHDVKNDGFIANYNGMFDMNVMIFAGSICVEKRRESCERGNSTSASGGMTAN